MEPRLQLTVFGELPRDPVVFDPAARHQPGFLPDGVLDQGIHWVDRAGSVKELVVMTPSYRRNVICCLHRVANIMWTRAATAEIVDSPVWKLLLYTVSGAGLIGDADPHTWLDATPLLRRLHELEPTGPR